MLSYQEAEAKLYGREMVRDHYKTWLVRLDRYTIGVKVWNTVVVKIHHDGSYTLNTGGWRTLLTKNRINEYSPARLYQKKFEWYCGSDPVYHFFDGIRVDRSGKVLNADLALACATPSSST